jgi:hypothetical protein
MISPMLERHKTLAEVADQLQVKERWLRALVNSKDIPVLRRGRVIRFDAFALRSLEEALRQCPSKSPAGPTPAPSPSRAPLNYPTARGSAFDDVLKLTIGGSPKKKPTRPKSKSSVMPGTASVVGLDFSRRPR